MNLGGQTWKFEDGQWITGKDLKTASFKVCVQEGILQILCEQCAQNNFVLLYLFLLFTESGGSSSGREVQRLKKRNLQLEEENNLLKLKIETLLDMVRIQYVQKLPRNFKMVTKKGRYQTAVTFLFQLTQTTVEYHLMEKEVEDIKSQRQRKKL